MNFRLVLIGVLLAICPVIHAREAKGTKGVPQAMADAADRFLASLDEQQRENAKMSYDDPRRLDWHNIPKPQRKGLQLGEMTDEQQAACHELLKAALSDSGYDKAVKILSLENNLREGEKHIQGGPIRDPERYFLTIFGEPGEEGSWGWSFEGHHFSLNFAIHDGKVVSDTPDFWGANPATVHTPVDGGPKAGTRTLAEEEELAFELLESLDDSQRAIALVADKAPSDYRGPGQPQPERTAPEGLAAKDLNERQRETLHKLLVAYCSHLEDELAAARINEIEARGLGQIHFAWYGAQKPGVGHAYRIQGPTFVLELVNVQSDPAGNPANHIHSVWRSLEGDFGVAAK
jgi:hypothetical protein